MVIYCSNSLGAYCKLVINKVAVLLTYFCFVALTNAQFFVSDILVHGKIPPNHLIIQYPSVSRSPRLDTTYPLCESIGVNSRVPLSILFGFLINGTCSPLDMNLETNP
ncbi:putative B ORF A [Vaccinia virus Copenhagen]|uniref:Uncharacterized 11.8 kDa protein n=5 Tax=Vaccinia virus TaxID=10245 RepID=YVBA_VACCW|nr:RecName: Full=Uncharacterized 11.8 kDa protein [Vaccinia virus WR]P68473.1 RecName: Full=Uncharacterized 11.8 kDa protein [Vaccinia virus Copenhagen]AAF34068.1 unknown [Vaccinia virus Tian Tan]ABZ80153.1 unknown [synthetic Vaccinia virus]AGJ91386.1 hypothetical protein VACV_TT8_236 [Vaccinia virus]AAA48195.1 putative B ORF A [Vaccinia virus Copenhagen]AGJ92477.1 hypothetical protein VACV_TT12_236 [Vaccinia virus]